MDYSKLTNEQLIDEYETGSTAISDAVSGVADEHLRTRVPPGKWSILEVLCHLVDSEIIHAERIRRVLAEESPTLFNLEPDDFGRAVVYDKRKSQQELNLIRMIRSQTTTILRSIPDAAWQRRGIHSTDGPITLRQLIERVTGHISHHVEFIQRKLTALVGPK